MSLGPMRRYSSFATTMVLSLSLATMAADADASSDSFYACTDKEGATNHAWKKCGVEYLAREDAQLNEVWKQAFGVAGPLTKADLLDEQRAWISYKEKACNFFYNGEQGREGQIIHIFACKGAVIDQRIKELEAYKACWADGAC